MKFNIEYGTLPHLIASILAQIEHRAYDRNRDLPVLFPYPRIYPGQSFRSCKILFGLIPCRAICVRSEPSEPSRRDSANSCLTPDTCATSNV